MTPLKPIRRRRFGRIAGMTVLFSAMALAGAYYATRTGRAQQTWDGPKAVVQRSDMFVTIRAGGRVESSQNTLLECELEAVEFRTTGQRTVASGASTILNVVPEGTMVKQGDILCQLDSSEYEELVRQQQIKVEESRADLQAAQLDLDAIRISLIQYRDGVLKELEQNFQGKLKLSQSDIQRQKDRVSWTERMVKIGYIPESRLAAERQVLLQAQVALDQTLKAYENLKRFTAPKMLTTLQSRVDGALSVLGYQKLRLARHEERLAHFKKQVERCTIRAPHDGFVIYAQHDDDEIRIEPGTRVRQKQDLFLLPDLSRMEVQAMLHESVVDRIRNGMPAVVRVEALPEARIEGHVIAVAPLPVSPRSWRAANDVKNFQGRIQLHSVPEGLRPGMTAEVEILAARKNNVLVIPSEALAIERGQEVCYVATDEGPVRREITLGETSTDLLEVTSGLSEGEEVILNPSDLSADASPLVAFPELPPDNSSYDEQPAL